MAKTIFIVEDNKEISDLLSSYLSDNKYEIIKAYDGETARIMLKNEKYDLVIEMIFLGCN